MSSKSRAFSTIALAGAVAAALAGLGVSARAAPLTSEELQKFAQEMATKGLEVLRHRLERPERLQGRAGHDLPG